MTPSDYLQQFQLALSTLEHLEQLWEPPIATTEACTIFLQSFPHHMVLTFRNFLVESFTPLDLTLDSITKGMENILSITPCTRHCYAATGHSPPLLIHRPNPQDFRSNKQELLLPIGPVSRNDHHLDPIYLGGIPACLESSLTNPATFTPDLSHSNRDGTIQAYLYWANLPPDQQPPASLMF